MKKYLIAVVAFVLCLLAVGCNQEITSGEIIEFDKTQTKDTILTVWMDDSDGIFMEEIIPAFEAQNPGITVEFQHMATVDAREKLKTFGQSGFGADVFQFPHDHMAQAILDDLVYPLPDELMNRLEERVLPVAMDIATSNYDEATGEFNATSEKLFAVPISIESVTIFYNKDLVAAENLPTTFEQLLEQSTAWHENVQDGKQYYGLATSSHWADGYFLQGIYSAFGGWTPFGPQLNDGSEVGFVNANVKNALTWMYNTLRPAVTGNGNHDSVSGATLFEEGKIPYLLTGPWQINSLKGKVDFGAITLPTIQGNPCKTYAGAQMVSVYKYSQNKDAAMKFVEFLASDEAAAILYSTSGDCPALKTEILDTIEGLKDDEVMQVMLDQLQTSVPMPTIPEVTYYWGPEETMVKNIWNQAADIETEMATAEKSYKGAKDLAS